MNQFTLAEAIAYLRGFASGDQNPSLGEAVDIVTKAAIESLLPPPAGPVDGDGIPF